MNMTRAQWPMWVGVGLRKLSKKSFQGIAVTVKQYYWTGLENDGGVIFWELDYCGLASLNLSHCRPLYTAACGLGLC